LELFVDGQAREIPGGEPFSKALEAIRRELSAGGRAIMSIHHNGAELSVEEENALCARPAGELGRVDLRSTPAREWGLHGLGEVASALGQLGDQFRVSADLFRAGQLSQGLDRANEVIGLFMSVLQALSTSLGLIGAASAGDLRSGIEGVVGAMRELEGAVRSGDAVAAADIAEYRLPEELEALAARVRALASSGGRGGQ